jgi:hypothetical protein
VYGDTGERQEPIAVDSESEELPELEDHLSVDSEGDDPVELGEPIVVATYVDDDVMELIQPTACGERNASAASRRAEHVPEVDENRSVSYRVDRRIIRRRSASPSEARVYYGVASRFEAENRNPFPLGYPAGGAPTMSIVGYSERRRAGTDAWTNARRNEEALRRARGLPESDDEEAYDAAGWETE